MAEDNKLETEAIARKEAARIWKQRRLIDYKECYFFAAPDRQRQLSSQVAPPSQIMLDAPELNTDIAMLLCADAVTEIINTYMPEAQIWCERKAGMDVPAEVFDTVKEEVELQDRKIFEAIKASNLYAELPKAFNPDLLIAGTALQIRRRKSYLPIEVIAVPMRKLEINIGLDNEIDDRFLIDFPRNTYVRTMVGEEIWGKLDGETKEKVAEKGESRTEVCWGWWRLWDQDRDEVWQHVVLVNNKLVHSGEIKGQGSCELIVTRFNPTADWAWAIGPMIQTLPSLRQVDELTRQKIEAVERSVNPAITYPDDSIATIEQGIEPGMAYPIRPGTEGAVRPIYQQPTIQPEIYQLEDMEHRLKKLFYVDHPEQTGDTPPTLGQWLDELARMQRRIGTAGYSFWREGPRAIFLRFKYLLEAAGTIRPVGDKSGRVISTQPYNPTQRAAEQQEIATFVQCGQILSQMFPEEWRMWIDGQKTMEAAIGKMRTSGLLKMRSEQEVKGAIGMISQLLGQGGLRQHAGAPVPEGAGAPAAA